MTKTKKIKNLNYFLIILKLSHLAFSSQIFFIFLTFSSKDAFSVQDADTEAGRGLEAIKRLRAGTAIKAKAAAIDTEAGRATVIRGAEAIARLREGTAIEAKAAAAAAIATGERSSPITHITYRQTAEEVNARTALQQANDLFEQDRSNKNQREMLQARRGLATVLTKLTSQESPTTTQENIQQVSYFLKALQKNQQEQQSKLGTASEAQRQEFALRREQTNLLQKALTALKKSQQKQESNHSQVVNVNRTPSIDSAIEGRP